MQNRGFDVVLSDDRSLPRRRWFRAPVPLFFGPSDRSLTQQQFVDECDVNNVIKRYRVTGLARQRVGEALYLDVSNMPDYHEALNAVNAADQAFASLSADVRTKFDNDPALFVDFMSDPANQDEWISLGLAKDTRSPKVVEVPAKPAEGPAAPVAS